LEKLFQILVYGYGNPGRQDDGLGSELIRRLEQWREAEGIEGLDFDENYQLNIEDAEIVSRYKLVIFADASTEDIGDFLLTDVDGEKDVAFTTHAASPGYILQLCHDLFSAFPVVKLLHIKGYEWEFQEGLSEKAEKNLDLAVVFIKQLILNFLNTST
jgi:hydrogenase maturation protease